MYDGPTRRGTSGGREVWAERFLVPVPGFRQWAALNAYLRSAAARICSDNNAAGTVRSRNGYRPIRVVSPLPAQQFSPADRQTRANSLSLVRFVITVPVPTQYAHHAVTAIEGSTGSNCGG